MVDLQGRKTRPVEPVHPMRRERKHLMADRAAFIPDTIWVHDGDGLLTPLHRGEDPDRWDALCASDEAIVTQVDDGTPALDGRGAHPSSSSSAPPLIAAMLDHLDLTGSETVLEIGAGTGWNAALLADRLGSGNVTTIECDPTLADHARTRLAQAGYGEVAVVTGDGSQGHPRRAPYDRVIATAAVHEIPYAWVEQTRPGGLIVAPFTPTLSGGGRLAVLRVTDGAATGHLADTAAFMFLRQQRPEPVWWGDDEARGDYTEHVRGQAPAAEVWAAEAASFGVGVLMPGCVQGRTVSPDGTMTLRVSDPATGSWASCTELGAGYQIRQHGPRLLWTDLEATHAYWTSQGRPDHTRFRLTVTSDGQDIDIC